MNAELAISEIQPAPTPMTTDAIPIAADKGAWEHLPTGVCGRRLVRLGWLFPPVIGVTSLAALSITGVESWWLSWPGLMVIVLALVSASTDTTARKIPNWLTYPTMVAGLMIGGIVTWFGPSAWAGTQPLGSGATGLIACLGCMLIPYRASGSGAGDVKLAAAYGVLLGWQAGLSIIITAYIVAGAGLMILQIFSKHPWLLPQALLRLVGTTCLPQLVNPLDDQQRRVLSRPIPLAGAFAVALIFVMNGVNLFSS